MPSKLSHYDGAGRARMVDVSAKNADHPPSRGLCVCRVLAGSAAGVAGKSERRSSGSGAAGGNHGRQANLRPDSHVPSHSPCRTLMWTLRLCENGVAITTKVATTAVTGVEMEALVAAGIAALTVYDMSRPWIRPLRFVRLCWRASPAGRAEITGDLVNSIRASCMANDVKFCWWMTIPWSWRCCGGRWRR